MYFEQRAEFEARIRKEINSLIRKAKREDKKLAIRLNGTSDLPGLARKFAKEFPDVQFYDYSKLPKSWTRQLPNYHITFSKSEDNLVDCLSALENGINVAVVFNDLPKTYLGRPVISGDETDLRFLDGKPKDGLGLIVGLTPKGRAKHDNSGFVVK